MSRRERRHADDVHIVLDRLAGRLLRRREERADIDVEAEIGESRGDHLLAAVMAVLAHLGDQDARPSPVARGEGRGQVEDAPHRCVLHADLPFVDAGDRPGLGAMAAESHFQRQWRSRRPWPWRAPPSRKARGGCPRPIFAASVSSASAVSTACGSRSALSLASFSSCWARTAELSTLRISISRFLARLEALTPTIFCVPESMRACVCAAASSMRIFGKPGLDRLRHAAEPLDLRRYGRAPSRRDRP